MAENEGKAACVQYFPGVVPGKRRQAAPKENEPKKKTQKHLITNGKKIDPG